MSDFNSILTGQIVTKYLPCRGLGWPVCRLCEEQIEFSMLAAVKLVLINGYNFQKEKSAMAYLKVCNPEYTFFSDPLILSVETLGLPAEMVAESVVDSIQTNNFDVEDDGSSSLIQAVLALSLGP